jgi:hypothetical protein
MSCIRRPIVSRDRPFEVDPARFDHFELGPGEPVGDDVIVGDRSWTLYAMDPDHDRALLVQLPDGFDLTTQPFAFVAQFERAVAAAEVPMRHLMELADRLPRPAALVHLFSTGRCGSTLASRIVAELAGIWSVSEPDAIGQLVTRRHEYGTAPMQAMLRAASLWSYRPTVHREGQTCVLKYRSEALFDATDYLVATPESTALFMYRDLLGWVDSVYRFAQKQGVDVTPGSAATRDVVWPILSAAAPCDLVADICDPNDPATPIEVVLTALWTLRIEAYRDAAKTGVPFHTVGYAELDRERAETVASLLRFLGHDDPGNRVRALRAYEVDSQQGTAGARATRARQLDDRQRERVEELARGHTRIHDAVEYVDALSAGRT